MGAGASVEDKDKEENFEGFEKIVPRPKPPLTEGQKRSAEVDKMIAENEINERNYENAVRALRGDLSLEDEKRAKEMGRRFKKKKREEALLKMGYIEEFDKDTPSEDKYKKG